MVVNNYLGIPSIFCPSYFPIFWVLLWKLFSSLLVSISANEYILLVIYIYNFTMHLVEYSVWPTEVVDVCVRFLVEVAEFNYYLEILFQQLSLFFGAYEDYEMIFQMRVNLWHLSS